MKMEMNEAAWPDEVIMAPTPPSSAAIFLSTASTVGLEILVYMWPGDSRSKRAASSFALLYLYVVL